MNRSLFIPLLLAVALVGCDAVAPSADLGLTGSDGAATAMSRVVNHVSAGGNDACEAFGLEPGCDGNFSFTAQVKANGSVRGQYQDTFNGGGNGVHGDIDCVNIVGNGAVVGGTITRGQDPSGNDLAGLTFLTAVVDNGTSSQDPPDQISFTFFDPNNPLPTCDQLVPGNFPLFDLTRGQVRVN